MIYNGEDLRLIDGGLGVQHELPSHDDSPTWVIDHAWSEVQSVCRKALDAYMLFCQEEKYPHSYLLGLDVLIMGHVDPQNQRRVIDIHPTLVEGPCCNSYPACPNLESYKLYRRLQAKGFEPDRIDYPVHPTTIRSKMAQCFIDIWRHAGHEGLPRMGVFTRAYPESEEEASHQAILEGLLAAGIEAYRVTPAERPEVKDGQLWVQGKPLDICYRRIERIHIPMFYGVQLGNRIIAETPKTVFVNPLKVDDLRSKTIEENVFRRWEAKTGGRIPRPRTLLADEITSASVRELFNRGGYVMKRWNSTGGKGVFIHVNADLATQLCDHLYLRYDGRHMILLDHDAAEKELAQFDHFQEDTAIQQLRFVDARNLGAQDRLVYDTRINVLYNPVAGKWDFLSGISRSVPCGPAVTNGNSLLTNISAGAEISPLVIGASKPNSVVDNINFGPLLTALMQGKNTYSF